MASRAATFNIDLHGTELDSVSLKRDAVSLALALLLHVPFYFMKVDAHKHRVETSKERLVSVDLLDSLQKEEPAPPPAPIVKTDSIKDKLMKLVRKEPPPPPPPAPKPVPEQKLQDAPNKIAIQPKLDLAQKIEPKLQTKEGFKTQADPKLIEQKNLAMNVPPTGIAPLSAKRVGVIENRDSLKSDKGKFAVGAKEVSDIGGDTGPSLAGAAPAPTLAIRTGAKSVEKFSAAPLQKSDKGRIGGVPVADVGGANLGLRDSIIARDATPTQIAAGKAGGVAGGLPGGVIGGTRRDQGRFEGSDAGGVAGGKGSIVGGAGTSVISKGIPATPKAREKKNAFSITGPLKDRDIERQVAPEYPAWAQAQGIEASVILEFTVDPTGMVKPNIVVRRTSGYPKLDDTAIKALRQWKFVPLPPEKNEDQIGLITFNYSLS